MTWTLAFDNLATGNGGRFMNRRDLKRLDARIKAIKKAAHELQTLSGGIPAIDRNVYRILASVRMLEINISDLVEFNVPL